VSRLLILATAFLLSLPAGSAAGSQPLPAEGQKQVLVLFSVRRDAQLVIVGERELTRILKAGVPEGIDYYSEFIDQGRFQQADYVEAFRQFVRAKYRSRRFDLVIAVGDVPLSFVERFRQDDAFSAPLVFFRTAAGPRPPDSTGLTAVPNLRESVEFAAALQPDVRNVFVISGAAAADLAFEGLARAQLAPLESRLAINYLSGVPAKRLEERVAHLPPHSIVYYLVVQRDASGESFLPLEYLDRLTAAANAPVYSWVDSAIGHGIVGGSLKDQVAQMRAIGSLALRPLHGERADSIPTQSPDLNSKQADWRELRRWGISEARVPPGTLLLFRELSPWQRYRTYILAATALLLAQTVLISGLLFQRARRRAAEDQAVKSGTALRHSYDRIRDLGARLLRAQETERARIARELHDDISQQMALLIVDLTILKKSVPSPAQTLTDGVLTRAHQISGSVHDLSHSLHPAKLRLIGLVPALQALQTEMGRSHIPISFTHDHVPAVLAPELALSLFRIVQEGVQNAVKYSRASQISVKLCGGPDALTLTIEDDGIGFDVASAWGSGLGLVSMQERLEPLAASLDIRSSPGAGTTVEVRIPAAARDNNQMVAV